MTLKERAAYYRHMIDVLNQTRKEDAIRAGYNASALVKARIQRHGQNYLGQPFAPYTKDYARRGRKALGYATSPVDFTREGRLFRSIGVFVSGETSDSVTVSLRSDTKDGNDKLKGAKKKRGNILRVSEQERTIVAKEFARYRVERLNLKS